MSEYHEGLDKGIELFKRESAELRAQVAALQADLARVTGERDAVKETLLGESGERCVNSIIKLANIAEKFQRSSEKAEATLEAERARAKGLQEMIDELERKISCNGPYCNDGCVCDSLPPPAVEKPIYMLNDDKHEQGIADAARGGNI